MKVVILVVITEEDSKFKNILIDHFQQGKQDIFEIFFVYGSGGESSGMNIYTEYPETFDNIVNKTLSAINVVLEHDVYDFIIRTNMSTLFDYRLLGSFIENLPRKNLYSGPFIANLGIAPMISGTCIIMTPDIAKYLVSRSAHIKNDAGNEDVVLSNQVNRIRHLSLNVKRLDFIQDRLLYHKCIIGDDDIFVYRFKTNDRNFDAGLMRRVSRQGLKNVIDSYHDKKYCELPMYSIIFNNPMEF